MKYIIDGYNVIHKVPELRSGQLRSQREGLVRFLEAAGARNRQLKDITVVFDGKSDVVAPQMRSSIKIVFSKGSSADKKIKQMLENSSFARDIAVVSDDREVRSYAGSLGAKRVSVTDFLKMAASSRKQRDTFKLDGASIRDINRELEKVWL
jgi:predicted RNA-binding protein with PIN domain